MHLSVEDIGDKTVGGALEDKPRIPAFPAAVVWACALTAAGDVGERPGVRLCSGGGVVDQQPAADENDEVCRVEHCDQSLRETEWKAIVVCETR